MQELHLVLAKFTCFNFTLLAPSTYFVAYQVKLFTEGVPWFLVLYFLRVVMGCAIKEMEVSAVTTKQKIHSIQNHRS